MIKLNNKLLCFSPPVMLATFVIEIGLLIYTLWRYKMTPVTRLVAAMLLFLAIFQLSEYMICGGLGWGGVEWARFGYASITILPPLGLHLAVTLAKKRLTWLVILAYLSAAAFIYFFVFVSGSMQGEECRPNYAVFHVHDWLVYFFVAYYYGWLAVTSFLSFHWSRQGKFKRQLRALCIGYAAFVIPTTLVNIINPETTAGIPSIMCGFAILMALTLALLVIPGTAPVRKK